MDPREGSVEGKQWEWVWETSGITQRSRWSMKDSTVVRFSNSVRSVTGTLLWVLCIFFGLPFLVVSFLFPPSSSKYCSPSPSFLFSRSHSFAYFPSLSFSGSHSRSSSPSFPLSLSNDMQALLSIVRCATAEYSQSSRISKSNQASATLDEDM